MTPARRIASALLAGSLLCALLATSSFGAAFGSRTLSIGAKGKDVVKLQRSLTTLGYAVTADGMFGRTTRGAVRKLEREEGWRVDGKITRKDALKVTKLLARRSSKAPAIFYLGAPIKPTATVTAERAGTATVNVINEATGLGVYSLPITFESAGSQTFTWSGATVGTPWAVDGVYRFRLTAGDSAGAAIAPAAKPFTVRRHAFPLPGTHNYGGALSRFGAPRSGHIHQGQDMSASCGEPLLAAETGKVTTRAYQASGAGYYLVIQGTYTRTSHVYMHLQKASWAAVGTKLYAGQQVGRVGTTGSSTGCHLHFERWSAPGWYAGGAAYDPLAELQYWDGYS